MSVRNAEKRVVITGAGPISAIGIGKRDFGNALLSQSSNISRSAQYEDTLLDGLRVAEISEFSVREFLPPQLRKSVKVMCRDIQLAVASSLLAIEDAGWQLTGTEDRSRWGCISGAGVTNVEHSDIAPAFFDCMEAGDAFAARWGEHSLKLLPPLMILKYLPNMAASHISIIHRLTGLSNTITCGEPSGHLAIGEGYNAIRRGACDLVVAGGAESKTNPTDIVYQKILGRIGDDEPVLGEGAGYVVLEPMQVATNRNANILCEIKAFASRQSHAVDVDGFKSGIENLIHAVLKKANLASDEIGVVFVSSTGSPLQRKAERFAIQSIFGEDLNTQVFDARGLYGNCHAGNSLDIVAAAHWVSTHANESRATRKPTNGLSLSCNGDGQYAAIIVGAAEY